jgi:uncharacterized protein
MNREEQQLIEDLFARLRNYGGEGGKDPEAELLIRDLIRRSPDAPYFLAQTVIVQQQALERAEARMRQLEEAASQSQQYGSGRGGSFLPGTSVPVSGGRFSGGTQYAPQRAPEAPAPQSSPWSSPGGGGSGGFLASALSTAAGVAGGVFLADGIRSLFGGSSASAWGSSGGGQRTINSLQDEAQDARDDADQAQKDLAADDAELDRMQDAADDSDSSWDDDSSLDI